MKNNYIVGAVVILVSVVGSVFVARWYAPEKVVERTNTIMNVSGPTTFDELAYGTTGVKEGWVRLTQTRGNHTNASTTNQFQVQNADGRNRIVDRIIVMRSGTSTGSHIVEIATTTASMITGKKGASSLLYNYDLTYARATVTPLIMSILVATNTNPYMIIDSSIAANFSTTTFNPAGSTYTSPMFSVDEFMKGVNGTYVWFRGSFEWKPDEYITAAINNENYANRCGGALGFGAGLCTRHATSSDETSAGSILDIFIHYIATTTTAAP